MKKTISILLVVLLLSSFVTLPVFATDEGEYTQGNIIVDNYGTFLSVKVFVSEDETILVPVDILSFCGGLYETSDNSDYIYYDGVQGIGYEKEIRISKNGKSGKSVVYITPNSPLTISSAKFSDSYVYGNELYLPLAELLPFLDAKVEITTDGVLHIYPNPVSIFNAIAYDNLDADIFSVNDVVAGGFVGATGYILDTIINLRFDRLDIILNTGAVKDYNKLFETLLTYNETYLSAFDAEKTPLDIVLDEMSSTLGDYNDFVESVDDSTKVTKAFFYIIDSDLFKNNKEFAKDMEGFKEFGTAVEGVYKTIQYFDAFNKQVDDHRNMLNAVYGGKYYTDSAKCNAANETALKYGGETAGFLVSSVSSTLREAIVKAGSGAISKSELLLPYKLTFDFLKFYRPEMKETLEDTSNMFYLDIIVSDSSDVAKELMASKTFDEKTLEDLRLSMIMALLTSKYAYEIYYDASLDYGKTGLDVDWKYYKINEWLTRLYLAADSVECNTPEYYGKKKAELTEDVKFINLGPSNGLEYTLNDDWQSYTVTGIGTCTDTDIVIPSTYNGKIVTSIGDFAFKDCTSLTSVNIPDSVTSVGIAAFSGCISLTSVNIPDSVTNVGIAAFGGCTSFQPNEYDNAYYLGNENNPYVILIGPKEWYISNCTLNENTKVINSYSFVGCTSLSSITIPDSVTTIGYMAFEGCTSLASVDISDSVTSIGDEAFAACPSLTSVDISGSVTSIGDQAFAACTSLTVVNIGDSVTSIGERVFEKCTSLTSIHFDGTVAQWNAIEKGLGWNYLVPATEVVCSNGTVPLK